MYSQTFGSVCCFFFCLSVSCCLRGGCDGRVLHHLDTTQGFCETGNCTRRGGQKKSSQSWWEPQRDLTWSLGKQPWDEWACRPPWQIIQSNPGSKRTSGECWFITMSHAELTSLHRCFNVPTCCAVMKHESVENSDYSQTPLITHLHKHTLLSAYIHLNTAL